MSTNIIDAFIVSFGIDARNYKTGEREVRDSLKRTKEEAKSTFDDFEDRGKKSGIALRQLANEAAGFFLVLAGANSMKDFAAGLIHSEADAGRLAQRLDMLPSKVIAWQQAVKGVGGGAGDASSALQAMSSASQNFQLTGKTGSDDAAYRRLGIDRDTLKRGDPTEMLLKIAAAGEKLSKPVFNNLMGRIGMSPSMVTLLMQGRGELEKTLKVAEAHADVTERDVKAAQQFEKALADLTNTIQGLARGPLTTLVEGLNDLLTNADGATSKMIGLSRAGRGWALAMAEIKAAREGRWNDLGDLLRQDFTDATGATRNGMTPGGDANGKFRNGAAPAGTPQQEALWNSLKAQSGRIGGGGAPRGTASDSFIQNYLKRSGFTEEQSRGIWAGIIAEGGSLGQAPKGGFGIGQWLGPRKKALLAQYGQAPTLEQQLAFLVSELKGGDHGGPSVGRQTNADHTLLSYVWNFMRPQGARNEHYMDAVRDVQRGRNALAGRGGNTSIGTINVHTKATDAAGIARSIGGALKFRHTINQANSGIAP